jgi:hypothetical protein
VFGACQQLDWAFAVIALFHCGIAYADANKRLALPFMPDGVTVMFMAHAPHLVDQLTPQKQIQRKPLYV